MDRTEEDTDETMPEEKLKTDEGETGEMEISLPKNEKQILHGSSSDSPVKHQKRKSQLIVEYETKRKKGAECEQKVESENKSLIYSSNIQEADLERDGHLQKDEENLASGNLKEQNNVNSSNKMDETGSVTHEIQAPISVNETISQSNDADKNETNPSHAALPRQDMAVQVNLDSCIASTSKAVQISSMNLKGVSNVETENSQMKLDSTSDGNERRNIVSLRTENKPSTSKSDSSFHQPKSCLSKNDGEKLPVENKNVDSVSEREASSSREIEQSYYVSLQMKNNPTDMNEVDISSSSDRSGSNQSVREILKHKEFMLKSERKLLRRKEKLLHKQRELLEESESVSALMNSDSRHRNSFGIPDNPAQNSGSGCELVAEFDQYRDVYQEPEFTATGEFQVDPEFLQTQQAILESHSRQHHSERKVRFDSKIKDERRMPAQDQSTSSGSTSGATDDEITICRQNILLKTTVGILKQHVENLARVPEGLHLQLIDYARNTENHPRFTESEKASEAKSTVANEKTEQEVPENSSDKEANNRVLLGNLKMPLTLFSNDNSKSPSVMSPGTENPRSSVIVSPRTEIFKTPIKSPSPEKREDNNNSPKTGESAIIYREYPGIAKEPGKVKKDARYQKKFYKQKPVKLPINWNWGMEAATNEPEMEDDQDKDETQRGCSVSGKDGVVKKLFNTDGNDPPSLSMDRAGDDDEPVIVGEKKPSAESDLTNASESGVQSTDGYKLSSFKEETPANSSTDSEEESDKLLPRASEKKSPKSR